MGIVLQTENLTKIYGTASVVNNVSMRIDQGDIYGFVGRNGAGKTTLMRLICGLIKKSSGSFELFGCSDSSPKIEQYRKKLGAIIEAPSVYPNFTAKQNLKVNSIALGVRDDNIIPRVLSMVNLEGTGNKKVKDFSLGMRQRLGIAISLLNNPEFLILDEPVNGLDPQGIIEVRDLLKTLNRQYGVTVFISSHILGELSKLATKFGFIENGNFLKEIGADELENACRKRIVIYIDKTEGLAEALKKIGIKNYAQISENIVELYEEPIISSLAFALRDEGIQLNRVVEKGEDLEEYFIGLIGGLKK